MSRIGVPSMRSAPETMSWGPSGVWSRISSSFTADSPMGLGRKGERVAKTPMRSLPPSRGGRTVGDQPAPTDREKTHTSHRWEKPSSPRRASGLRYSGAKTTAARRDSTRPLCLGMPNLVGKSLRMWATGARVRASDTGGHLLLGVLEEGEQLLLRHGPGQVVALEPVHTA